MITTRNLMSSEDSKYVNNEPMAQTNPSALERGVAVAPQPMTKTANPSPLGLLSFGITTFILGLYHCGAGLPNSDPSAGPGPDTAIIGMALFMGGAAQFAAGMWEFKVGNLFGATAFTSYGSFWLSYAVLKIEGFGVAAGYKGDERPCPMHSGST